MLADTIQLCAGIEDRYRWHFADSYSPAKRGQQNGGGSRGSGHSDPTAGAALDEWNQDRRHAMADACKHTVEAHRAALKAYRALARSEEREPDHPYAAVEPTWTTKDERAELDAAKKRRRQRGGNA
jgi:hypothetical protein